MNEEYLETLRADTHRGLLGRFDRKLATGGCPFGYRTVPIVVGSDAHGRPQVDGFELEVDPELAPIVGRLFEGYALQGLGLRTLSHQSTPRAIRRRGGRAGRRPRSASSSGTRSIGASASGIDRSG